MSEKKELKGAIVECVPNFSEGREPDIIKVIMNEIDSVQHVKVLDLNSDIDHNRSVITFIGQPSAVIEAAVAAVRAASRLINLNKHQGVHPRIGAADVVPIVPIRGISMDECVALARELAKRIWNEIEVPTYLYGFAALREDRIRLERVRMKGFEQMRELVTKDKTKQPDFGGPVLHPTAGATIVGARAPLIAFNVNLNSTDLNAAKKIAEAVREKNSGLIGLKALGLELKRLACVQVSTNITRTDVVSPYAVFEKIKGAAEKRGISVKGSELIGLVPLNSVINSTKESIHLGLLNSSKIIELNL